MQFPKHYPDIPKWKWEKIEKKPKPIPKKQTDNRKRNTKRKVTKEVAKYVLQRDDMCIICKKEQISQIHHCYYWKDAIYTDNRNDIDQLVWLCETCHILLHFHWDNNYRQECIDYLQNYYAPYKIAYSLENMKEDRVLMNEYVQKHAFSHP